VKNSKDLTQKSSLFLTGGDGGELDSLSVKSLDFLVQKLLGQFISIGEITKQVKANIHISGQTRQVNPFSIPQVTSKETRSSRLFK
jgi:hypothetical protein